MRKRPVIWIVAGLLLASCSNAPSVAVVSPTAEATSTAAAPPGPASATAVLATPTVTPALTAAATAAPASRPPDYIDDRSSPEQLIRSMYNAVNDKEYARAYSYWSQNSQLRPFAQFQQGYADTASVQVTFGTITSSGAAGSVYYNVPVTLVATSTVSATQTYSGCYTVRLPQPANFGAPPIQPMSIEKGVIAAVPAGANPQSLLSQACAGQTGQAITPQAPNPPSIGTDYYIDDRSTAESTVRSMFNAINLHEYVRAYSYMEDAPGRLPYNQFQQGYANTASVQISFGNITSGAAAGNLYWSVPTLITAQTTTGQTTKYVSCFTVHLAQPALQAVPPYHPMSIQRATLQQVTGSDNADPMLARTCANP